MRKPARIMLLAALVLGAGAIACDDEDPTIVDNEQFSATLGPEGSVQTAATGTASFTLEDGVVSYTIDVSDITGVTAAHIHGPAGSGQTAGVLVPLYAGPEGGTGAVDGELVSAAFDASDITASAVSIDSLLVLMRNGQSYVNVHTTANPPGEIRGQILAQ